MLTGPRFRDAPIRRKLMIIIMATTATAMLLACFGILVFDSVLFRANLGRDLQALAQITAGNSTASLEFDDSKTASETLSALRARLHLVTACLYEPDGTMLARYVRATDPEPCPPPVRRDDIVFGRRDATVSWTITMADKPIGTLMFLYDLGEIGERRQLYGTIVVAVLLVASLIALLLSRSLRALIEDPIAQLVKATTAVAETGDYGIRAKKVTGDELGLLTDGFNEMLAGIQSRDNRLTRALLDREEALRDEKKARERFRFLAESMPQKIFTATPDGEVNYFNQQWIEFSGLSADELRHAGWAGVLHPDDLEADEEARAHALATGEPYNIQHRFRRADGEYRWHLTRVHAMRDEEGKILMWIGSNTDIHEQKEREEALRRANDDLQQFAYSASHDLQEPIRNVTIYSEIIGRRYKDVLDADGRQFLGFLTEGGRRMAMLINDLLAYTRAGAADVDVSLQDSNTVLQQTLAGLAEAIRESGATVTHDELPRIYIGEAHLQQVLQNLISNAIKYRTEEPPKIHISAVNQGAAWQFSVKDNGIGIDPQYKEKIFGVFKRLHRDQKYSGTGVGLAICQRVVERYGGRIWVESSAGHGATFHFTVPRYAGRVQRAAAEHSDG
ncbi:MAG TPA: ATP-binding protein [Bryobacteraceae bacterium]|nr:ATP-binding protein [Bryobacteraceae bacterium]